MAPPQSVAVHIKRRFRQSGTPMDAPIRRFFKIILQTTIEDGKLMLPSKFAWKHGKELSDTAKLSVSNGRVWRVGLKRERKNIWLDNGWHEFAKHYSICDGHWLMFKYKGMSNFSVYIFNISACEIPYPLPFDKPTNDREDSTGNDQDCGMEDDSPFHISGSAAYPDKSIANVKDKRKRESKMHQVEVTNIEEIGLLGREIIVREEFDEILLKVSPESKRAVSAARMYKPKNYAFMAIIWPEHKKTILRVPAAFANIYRHESSRDMIRIQISDERQWQSNWVIHPLWGKCGGLILEEGWAGFVFDNYLMAGDVCVLELMNSKTFTLKASVFHAYLD